MWRPGHFNGSIFLGIVLVELRKASWLTTFGYFGKNRTLSFSDITTIPVSWTVALTLTDMSEVVVYWNVEIFVWRSPPRKPWESSSASPLESWNKTIHANHTKLNLKNISVVVDFLFIVTPIVGVCNCSLFCCTLLYVHSCIAIILMGKRELVALLNLSSWCLVMIERLFLAAPRGCLQFVIVVLPDHTHYFYL